MKTVVVGRSGWLTLTALMVMVVGCSSMHSPVPRLEAKAHEYGASFDDTWTALNDVLTEKRLPKKAFEKDSGVKGG